MRSKNAAARASASGSGGGGFHALPRGVSWTIRGTAGRLRRWREVTMVMQQVRYSEGDRWQQWMPGCLYAPVRLARADDRPAECRYEHGMTVR